MDIMPAPDLSDFGYSVPGTGGTADWRPLLRVNPGGKDLDVTNGYANLVQDRLLDISCSRLYIELLVIGDRSSNHAVFKVEFERWHHGYKGVRLNMTVNLAVPLRMFNNRPHRPGSLMLKLAQFQKSSTNSGCTIAVELGPGMTLRHILPVIFGNGLQHFAFLVVRSRVQGRPDNEYGCRDWV
jgi:hypothetical protein